MLDLGEGPAWHMVVASDPAEPRRFGGLNPRKSPN